MTISSSPRMPGSRQRYLIQPLIYSRHGLEFFLRAGFGTSRIAGCLRWEPGSGRALRPSEHLEIFAMLPVRDLGLKTFDLGVLDVDVIVDETRTERPAKERIIVERKHR